MAAIAAVGKAVGRESSHVISRSYPTFFQSLRGSTWMLAGCGVTVAGGLDARVGRCGCWSSWIGCWGSRWIGTGARRWELKHVITGWTRKMGADMEV